jgi:hypothetical protein
MVGSQAGLNAARPQSANEVALSVVTYGPWETPEPPVRIFVKHEALSPDDVSCHWSVIVDEPADAVRTSHSAWPPTRQQLSCAGVIAPYEVDAVAVVFWPVTEVVDSGVVVSTPLSSTEPLPRELLQV